MLFVVGIGTPRDGHTKHGDFVLLPKYDSIYHGDVEWEPGGDINVRHMCSSFRESADEASIFNEYKCEYMIFIHVRTGHGIEIA